MSELDKLGEYLVANGYKCTRKDKNQVIHGCNWDKHQIVVYDEAGNYLWDAICHRGSYGYERGLLEIMGSIVQGADGDVEGWLTAQEIINRLEAK